MKTVPNHCQHYRRLSDCRDGQLQQLQRKHLQGGPVAVAESNNGYVCCSCPVRPLIVASIGDGALNSLPVREQPTLLLKISYSAPKATKRTFVHGDHVEADAGAVDLQTRPLFHAVLCRQPDPQLQYRHPPAAARTRHDHLQRLRLDADLQRAELSTTGQQVQHLPGDFEEYMVHGDQRLDGR